MRNEQNDLILSCSTITGSTVKTLSDETIGTIKDIMLDTETGEVVYTVLSVNTGFLNMGSKYFAIPWQAFSFTEQYDDVFLLDVDKERLEHSPGFDKDNWPSGPQTEFIKEMNAYYGIERNQRSTRDSDYESDSGIESRRMGSRSGESGLRSESGLGTDHRRERDDYL